MRAKHLLKLILKFTSLLRSNRADLQSSMSHVIDDNDCYRASGIALLVWESSGLEALDVVHTCHVLTATETRRRHAAVDLQEKTCGPASGAGVCGLWYGEAIRRTFASEQATHGVHWPESSTPICFPYFE